MTKPIASDIAPRYWSPLAKKATPLGLGYRRGKLTERYVAPSAVVIHTTGAGPGRRALDDKFAVWRSRLDIPRGDALRCAVVLYTHVMDAAGHYVVGQDGTIVQVVPESFCAWHVGGSGSRPYFNNPTGWHRGSKHAWWVARWAGYESPRNLGGGHLWDPPKASLGLVNRVRAGLPIGSANANSIGIEVVPDARNPTAPWSAEAWDAVARLVLDVCARNEIPVKRDRVFSHSDAHPLSRTTPSGHPWDPSPAQYSWDRFERAIAGMRHEVRA
jgi:hypothetical protein